MPNTPMTQPKQMWEERFDLIPHGAPLSRTGDYVSVVNAKKFIAEEISKAKEEERERMIGEFIKLVDGVNDEYMGVRNGCEIIKDRLEVLSSQELKR